MHFHLPKPLHGWREFFGEVGIIVIGVLIALTAEQLVEAWHWHHELKIERRALDAEAIDALASPLFRLRIQPCVDARLAEIGQLIDRHRLGEPLRITGHLSPPARSTATTRAWDIALNDQALAHMPHDEKLAYDGLFYTLSNWNESTAQEREGWMPLTMLNKADVLSPSGWDQVIAAYTRAVEINDRIRLLAPFVLSRVQQEKNLAPNNRRGGVAPGFEQFVQRICQSLTAPEQGEKQRDPH